MCGIAAVIGCPSERPVPSRAEVEALLSGARATLKAASADVVVTGRADRLRAAARELKQADGLLKGVPGLACLMAEPSLAASVTKVAAELEDLVGVFEVALDGGRAALGEDTLEEVNSALVDLHDVLWALGHDRLDALAAVEEMTASLGLAVPVGRAALGVLWAVHVALRSLDRLEVRGRDSAGLHLMLSRHGLDLASPGVAQLVASRSDDPLFRSMAVHEDGGTLSLVYKTAAEIGELGDNVARLRRDLASDPLLAGALASSEVTVTVLGHTRWASVGLVSEPNAHPLDSQETEPLPYVVGALNGDVDNFAELVASDEAVFPPEITTDAKIVPDLVARYLGAGQTMGEAFRSAVGRFEGSVGIAVNGASEADAIYLALRGSGQGLNIGLAEDAFVVASEAYGVVEETSTYLRLDGERGGQVACCRRQGAGSLSGLTISGYDGANVPIGTGLLQHAHITTRDVDRAGYRHFLLKEMFEAPQSVRKTLRGKVLLGPDGPVGLRLDDEVVPAALAHALSQGQLKEVLVIGQGTAAVAGQAVASAIARSLPALAVKALPATELSGWGPLGTGLPDDMSNCLVVAISQSGTTTDTNRTVDMVRGRGAHVIAIVNRRHSDLVQKSHGVFYTSDGRDVEMSVASTKAFYSQVVAGHLLALGLAQAAGRQLDRRAWELLAALRQLPGQLEQVLAQRADIARVAANHAPYRRSWAVVGSGPDRVAAAEVRIKLSELCYKAISLDSVEDKKHIDLSAEPLVLVCASAVVGANAQDMAKEVQIFCAHKAAPVVIAPASQRERLGAVADLVTVPECHPELSFVLAAMAGHIFGYEAALSIDAQSRPLREARALVEQALATGADLGPLAGELEAVAGPALAGLRGRAYDGSLNASTAARLVLLLRYATGALPIEGYEAEMGRMGSPAAITADLVEALGVAIDELTRPIDAIKHQAKTVTVGISRSEQPLLGAPLAREALGAGASVEALGYRALRTLAALGPAVQEVVGFTRYRIEVPGGANEPGLKGALVDVVDQGGVARGITSRTSSDHTLRGTKHRAADKREVTVFRGLHDGRTGVIVPEVKDGQVTGLTLLHARFVERLGALEAKGVLESYQGRYTALVDAVTEGRPSFDDQILSQVDVVDLLTEPVAVLARRWGA